MTEDDHPRTGSRPLLLGLRTAIHPAPDLAASEECTGLLGAAPYLDQDFSVGFSVAGYELALARLLAAGAQPREQVREVGDGIRTATVTEPGGSVLGVIENPRFRPARRPARPQQARSVSASEASDRPADPAALRARLLEVAPALGVEVTTRAMMGGWVGCADGRPFVSLSTGSGIQLLPTDAEVLLVRPGARRLRHSPEQPESRTYVAPSPGDVDDDVVLEHWSGLAARTTPAPRRRS